MTTALLLLAASISAPTPAEPIGDPGTWITTADYPTAEAGVNATGETVAGLLIDNKGAVTDCRVKTSSGSETLDATACALLKARGRFHPARDGKGMAVDSIRDQRVLWKLEGGNTLPVPTSVSISIDVSAQGLVENCSVVEPRGTQGPTLNPCLQFPTGRKVRPVVDADGKPTPYRVIQTQTRTFEMRP